MLRTAESRRTALALALLLAVAAALRFWNLGLADLTEDEELSTGLPLLSYGELFYDIAGRPPLAFLLQKIVTDISGSASAFWLRLASLLEGLAALPLLFFFVRTQFGARPASIATLLLATSHFHVVFSRDARYYPLLMLVCLAVLAAYWSVLARQRWRALPLLAVAVLAVPLTHYAGYLFLAALALAAVPLLLSPPWIALYRKYPRRALGGMAGAAALAAIAAFLLRGYLATVTKHLAWPELSAPLPPLFDVTPEFLGNRFSEVMGIPAPFHWAVAVLCLLGLARSARVHWAWPAVSLAILIVPFLLYWLFPPDHPWHPKYFIFQLPVLWLCAALGIDTLALLFGRIHVRAATIVSVALVLALALPNLQAIRHAFAHPDLAQRSLGADLAAWSTPEDRFFVTWEGQPRILRHDFPPIEWPTHQQLIRPQQPFPWNADGAPYWYLLPGKLDVAPGIMREILSARFSRVAHDEVFLARSPSVQALVFGSNAPGSPDAQTALHLAPGAEHRMRVLLPREGRRAVLADIAPLSDVCATLRVRIGDVFEGMTDCVSDTGGALELAGYADCTRGLTELVLTNDSAGPITVRSLHIVPALESDSGNGLNLPAWDFLELSGGDNLSSIWVEERGEGLMLRDFRHGQAATFVLYSDHEGTAVLEIAALNDAPFANRYQVVMPGTALEYKILEFDREDGSVSRLQTPTFSLQRGLYTVSVGYIGVPEEDRNRATRDGRARTEETLQNSGLLELVLRPGARTPTQSGR